MRLFAVRIRESKIAVGIFFARSVLVLARDLIDQFCDPSNCEYRSITADTGIFFNADFAMGVDIFKGDDDTESAIEARVKDFSKFEISETQMRNKVGLAELLLSREDVTGWKPIVDDEVDQPSRPRKSGLRIVANDNSAE
jgi:hypothetical protein